MGYLGEPLTYCPVNLDLSRVEMVIVSGDTKWGHALLHVPKQGLYFQVAGVYAYPTMMNDLGYKRYLSEHNKREIKRLEYALPQPSGAYSELMQSTSKKWTWGGVINNCTTFVEDVIRAGGSSATINNLPTSN